MKTARNASIILILSCLIFVSCRENKPVEPARMDYSDPIYWYSSGDESHEADVFYIYPTVSTVSFVDNDSSWYADIRLPTSACPRCEKKPMATSVSTRCFTGNTTSMRLIIGR